MRFWEIDFFRGIAVLLMVFFNWSFALYYLQLLTTTEDVFFWFWFPRIIAAMFIFIAGVAMAVSYAKNSGWKRHAKRGAKLIILGLAITAVTYAMFPKDFIVFGILHFIGAATLLSLFLLKRCRKFIPIAAPTAFVIGLVLQNITFDFPYLLWLGFAPNGFSTLDYFPLLPWLGIFLLGTALGNHFYAKGKRQFKISQSKLTKPLEFMGRHSLLIYIVHQPLLIVILFVLGIL
jgi:uncharacterized membrane protein